MTMTDHCPLGTSMLKKLGWSEGKGLGPREQGRKEPVAVRPKRDNSGIGAAASSTTRPGLGLASGPLGSVPGLELAGQWSIETGSLDEVFERIRKGRRKEVNAKRSKSKRAAEGTQPSPSPAKRPGTEHR